MEKIDILVIGAGIIGLAIARTLSLQGRQVIVAERENMAGSITSARNSGVIHAGIYYPKGSNKARFCVKGKDLLYTYAKQRGIPFENCEKIIAAVTPDDLTKLENIRTQATQNGVTDLKILSKQEAIALEPNLSCLGALLSPSTGIIDIHTLIEEFIIDIENNNGIIAYENTIETAEIIPNGFKIKLSGSTEPVLTKTLINAAGLDAQTIAYKIQGLDKTTIPKLYRAKGNYFGISGKAPFTRLVYPVPVDGGLGAHFTKNIAGESLFGPDVEWLNDNDKITYTVNSDRAQSFYKSVKRFWPDVENHELIPAYAGIRPKLSGPGQPNGDFIIHDKTTHGIENLINLYGIESPGLTASMAIADHVQEILQQDSHF